jgi:hypothetical protein
MTKVYVVHVKGFHPDGMYSIAGIYTNVDAAYECADQLVRHSWSGHKVDGRDTWIETVALDE